MVVCMTTVRSQHAAAAASPASKLQHLAETQCHMCKATLRAIIKLHTSTNDARVSYVFHSHPCHCKCPARAESLCPPTPDHPRCAARIRSFRGSSRQKCSAAAPVPRQTGRTCSGPARFGGRDGGDGSHQAAMWDQKRDGLGAAPLPPPLRQPYGGVLVSLPWRPRSS